jgi:RHS repeat-associated protein
VAVEDPNHTNPYMFAGVRYDIEIGLYYNRARCYNPFMGRFLQTDPIGYEDGINWYLYCANNPVHLADPTGQFKAIFRGYSEQQIQDVMSGITAICEACEQRVREINQTLGSLNCTAHTPGGPECKRRPALEEARIRLRKIRDLIKSDDNTTIIFRLKNWGDTPVGGEIERLWAPSDDLTGEQRVRLTINSGDYGPWGDKDPSGHADPTLMGELLLHELSHLFGTEDTEEIDWGNAFKFDDFFISPIYKTQYYMVLEAECFKKPEED